MAQKYMWPLFCVVLALLATHELDAIARHEWRMLPVLSDLPDLTGRYWFILLHIPLFALLFWLTGHPAPTFRYRMQLLVDGLVIAHGVAHYVLSGHPAYEFQPPVETITVFGAASLAAVHALFLFKLRATGSRRR